MRRPVSQFSKPGHRLGQAWRPVNCIIQLPVGRSKCRKQTIITKSLGSYGSLCYNEFGANFALGFERQIQQETFGIVKSFRVWRYFVWAYAEEVRHSISVCQKPRFGFTHSNTKQKILWKLLSTRPLLQQIWCTVRVIKVGQYQHRLSICHLPQTGQLLDKVAVPPATKPIANPPVAKGSIHQAHGDSFA